LVCRRESSAEKADAKALAAFSNDWRQIGLEVDEIVIPIQRVSDREYRHTRPGFEVVSGSAEPEVFEVFRGSRAPLPSNSFVGPNRSRYMSPEYDALLDAYSMKIARSERVAVLGQIVHQLSDQLVFIGLSYTTTHTFVGKRLKNITGRGQFGVTGWNAEEWDVS
jgi:ABC-type transport system substrate-binding protein